MRCSSGGEAATTGAPAAAAAASGKSLEYTGHEGNSFFLRFGKSGKNVLVDPWLVGNLVFADADWLYKGVKRDFTPGPDTAAAIAQETDLILLTMSLPDHCHKPTLEALPKTIPVVASPSAAAVARELGFQHVTMLDHGRSTNACDGKLRVTATAGALVGPPWSKRENGFVLREACEGGLSLYYEPHCDYLEESVASVGPVDVVVSPPTSQVLAGVYPLVKGSTDNVRLLQLLTPSVMVALFNAEFDASGPLDAIIVEQGGMEELQAQTTSQGLSTRIVRPAKAGQPLAVTI